MSVLTLWLPDDVSAPWPWSVSDGRTGTAAREEQKKALAALGADRTDVILSGQSVRILPHELPAMREADRLKAAGFAIEDKLGAALKDQHIVLGAGEDARIGIISRERMDSVRDCLESAGLAAQNLYADYDVLEASEEGIALNDRIIYPGPTGHTVDLSWSPVNVTTEANILTPQITTDTALNFFSGDYRRNKAIFTGLPNLTRLAAGLLVAGLAWLGLSAAQNRALTQQADAMRAQAADLYVAKTGAAPTGSPAVAVTKMLKAGGGSKAGFMPLSDILFRATSATDGVMVDTLQYDAANDRLTLRLIYPRFESADALAQAVQQSGGTFQSGGVREQAGRLIGDAVITRGGGA